MKTILATLAIGIVSLAMIPEADAQCGTSVTVHRSGLLGRIFGTRTYSRGCYTPACGGVSVSSGCNGGGGMSFDDYLLQQAKMQAIANQICDHCDARDIDDDDNGAQTILVVPQGDVAQNATPGGVTAVRVLTPRTTVRVRTYRPAKPVRTICVGGKCYRVR